MEWITETMTAISGDPMMLAMLLALATFISEDGALILGSILVAAGDMTMPVAIGALSLGILVGDIGLYAAGLSARNVRWLRKRLSLKRQAGLRDWLRHKKTGLLFLSRFMPGTRLLTYVTFGFLRMPLWHFIIVMAIAAPVWVGLMVQVITQIQHFLSDFGPVISVVGAVIAGLILFYGIRVAARQGHYSIPTDTSTAQETATDTPS